MDFLDHLLRYDHQERLTAQEAMAHPYFGMYIYGLSEEMPTVYSYVLYRHRKEEGRHCLSSHYHYL